MFFNIECIVFKITSAKYLNRFHEELPLGHTERFAYHVKTANKIYKIICISQILISYLKNVFVCNHIVIKHVT
jgi:hypothetical protein